MVLAVVRHVRREAKAVEPADELALDDDVAAAGHRTGQLGAALERLDQHGRAPVDEPLGQAIVERVRQLIFDGACPFLPVARIGEPVRPVRDVGPGADVRDPRHQRIDVAFDPVQAGDHVGDPVGIQTPARSPELAVDLGEQARVRLRQDLAEVRHLAHGPEQVRGLGRGRQGRDLRVAGQHRQGDVVVGIRRPAQGSLGRPGIEALQQGIGRAEVEVCIAPHQRTQCLEAVGLDGLDHVFVDRSHLFGRAERAVVHVAAGTAGDLGDLRRPQPPRAAPVELAQAGEGDVVDVHVEAHADGIGGHQIVDLAGLVEADLGVAGPRAEGAQDDRGAAALAPHGLGNVVDVGRREGDDRTARRQPRQLARAGIGQPRQARTGDELGVRDQAADQRPDRLGAQEHRLLDATALQQAMGEDVPPLGVGAELDLVDGQEIHRPVERHALDRADEVVGARRQDLLLAGDQRDLAAPLARNDPVVVLAGQQPQREPDRAAGVAEHALDGEMCLAGVGRAKYGEDPGSVAPTDHGQTNSAFLRAAERVGSPVRLRLDRPGRHRQMRSNPPAGGRCRQGLKPRHT